MSDQNLNDCGSEYLDISDEMYMYDELWSFDNGQAPYDKAKELESIYVGTIETNPLWEQQSSYLSDRLADCWDYSRDCLQLLREGYEMETYSFYYPCGTIVEDIYLEWPNIDYDKALDVDDPILENSELYCDDTNILSSKSLEILSKPVQYNFTYEDEIEKGLVGKTVPGEVFIEFNSVKSIMNFLNDMPSLRKTIPQVIMQPRACLNSIQSKQMSLSPMFDSMHICQYTSQKPFKKSTNPFRLFPIKCPSSISFIATPNPVLQAHETKLNLINVGSSLNAKSLKVLDYFEIGLLVAFHQRRKTSYQGVGAKSLVRNIFDPGI